MKDEQRKAPKLTEKDARNEKIKAALKGCGIGVAASGGILLGVSFLF